METDRETDVCGSCTMVVDWIGRKIDPCTCTCLDGRKARRRRSTGLYAVAEDRAKETPRWNEVHPTPCSHRNLKGMSMLARDLRPRRAPWLGASLAFPSVLPCRNQSSPFGRTRTFHTLMHAMWTCMASTSIARVCISDMHRSFPSVRGKASRPSSRFSRTVVAATSVRVPSSAVPPQPAVPSHRCPCPGSFPFNRTTRSNRSVHPSDSSVQQTRPIELPSPDEARR